MDQTRTSDACKMSDLVADLVARMAPVHARYGSLEEVWATVLPDHLQSHCRIGGLSNGCLKILADDCTYRFELQLCKAVLLRELQRLCPSAKIHRIDVAMAR